MESIERAAWNFIPPAERESEQRMSHLLALAGGGECAHHRASGRTPTQQAAHGERDRREREREGEGAVTGHHDADAGERRKEGRVKAAAA